MIRLSSRRNLQLFKSSDSYIIARGRDIRIVNTWHITSYLDFFNSQDKEIFSLYIWRGIFHPVSFPTNLMYMYLYDCETTVPRLPQQITALAIEGNRSHVNFVSLGVSYISRLRLARTGVRPKLRMPSRLKKLYINCISINRLCINKCLEQICVKGTSLCTLKIFNCIRNFRLLGNQVIKTPRLNVGLLRLIISSLYSTHIIKVNSCLRVLIIYTKGIVKTNNTNTLLLPRINKVIV